MKKNLLKSMLAVALMSFGCMNVAAQEEEEDFPVLPVKMTYVDYYAADEVFGDLDTIFVGYTKAPAVGGTIASMKQGTDWNVSKVGFIQVDATAVPGIITKATLKAKITGCDTGRNRRSSFGVALTDNEWSAELTYNTIKDWTITALLNNNGVQAGTSTGNTEVFEEVSFDISDALQGADFTGFATIVVYETAAGGARLTEAYVEVEEYEPYDATSKMYDFEDTVIPFKNGTNSGEGRITAAIENDATLNSNVLGWTCAGNSQNGYSFSYYDFTELLNNPALVKVEFDYYNTKGGRAIMSISDAVVRGTDGHCEKVTYKPTGAIFRIGSDKDNAYINDIVLPQEDATTTSTITVTDEETGETSEVEVTQTQPGLCDRWMHVVVIVNNDAKAATWVVTDMEGELIHTGSAPFYSNDAVTCSQIDLFGYIKNSHCAMIDNLEITNYKSNAVFADYTIKYVDAEDNELKESRVGNGQVGKSINLLDSDKAAIYKDDMKYIYSSDNTAEVVITEEGTVVKVVFRQAEVYAAVLNCMIEGGTTAADRLASLSGFTFFEGDNLYVHPSRGYGKDGKYYFTEATSWNGKVVTFPGSYNSRTINGVVTYIGTENYSLVDTVAYYSEIERLALPVEDAGFGTGLGQLVGDVAPYVAAKGEQEPWYNWTGALWERFSGGRGIRLGEGSYVYTEPIAEAATYKVTIYCRNDNGSLTQKPILGLRDAQGEVTIYTELTIPEQGTAVTGAMVIEEVAIPAGSSLIIMNAGDATYLSLDDISMAISGEYVAPVTVGIQNVEKAQQNGVIYNLAGQAVKAVQKGLYIKNGKKYIVK